MHKGRRKLWDFFGGESHLNLFFTNIYIIYIYIYISIFELDCGINFFDFFSAIGYCYV